MTVVVSGYTASGKSTHAALIFAALGLGQGDRSIPTTPAFSSTTVTQPARHGRGGTSQVSLAENCRSRSRIPPYPYADPSSTRSTKIGHRTDDSEGSWKP